jgi:hypothetical protein
MASRAIRDLLADHLITPQNAATVPFLASRFAIVDAMNVIPGADERGSFADTALPLYPHDDSSIGGLRMQRRTAERSDEERAAVLGDTASRLITSR